MTALCGEPGRTLLPCSGVSPTSRCARSPHLVREIRGFARRVRSCRQHLTHGSRRTRPRRAQVPVGVERSLPARLPEVTGARSRALRPFWAAVPPSCQWRWAPPPAGGLSAGARLQPRGRGSRDCADSTVGPRSRPGATPWDEADSPVRGKRHLVHWVDARHWAQEGWRVVLGPEGTPPHRVSEG
jgi:hypothetical protein